MDDICQGCHIILKLKKIFSSFFKFLKNLFKEWVNRVVLLLVNVNAMNLFLTVMDVSLDLATSADWLNAREAADHLSESGAVLDRTFFVCPLLFHSLDNFFSFFQQFPFDLIRLQFFMQILCKWGAGKCLKFSFEKFDFVSNST